MTGGKVCWLILLAGVCTTKLVGCPELLRAQSSKQPQQAYAINEVAFSGAKSLSAEHLLRSCKLKKGSLVNDDDLDKCAALVARAYLRKGFSRVRVTPFKRNVGPFDGDIRRRINIVFEIEEGPQYLIRALEVLGTRVTPDRIVSRSIGLKPWDPYDPDAIKAAIKRLNKIRTLDVVNQEDIEITFDDAKHFVDLRFHLKERN